MQKMYCVNFGQSLGTFSSCQGIWHTLCYSLSNKIDFCILSGPKSKGDQERIESAQNQVKDAMECWRAWPGDYMSTLFECDLCVFMKLQNRYPLQSSQKDVKLLACIRKANLDAFWRRASTAVGNNARTVKRMIESSNEVRLNGPFMLHGSMPSWDYCRH